MGDQDELEPARTELEEVEVCINDAHVWMKEVDPPAMRLWEKGNNGFQRQLQWLGLAYSRTPAFAFERSIDTNVGQLREEIDKRLGADKDSSKAKAADIDAAKTLLQEIERGDGRPGVDVD